MPIYEHICHECERTEDVYYKMDQRPTITCGECGGAMPRHYTPVSVVGPTDTKPLVCKQIGRTFTSNKELNNYLKETGKEMTSASDKKWEDMADRAHKKADEQSKKMGYADFDDRKQKRKAEKIASGQIPK